MSNMLSKDFVEAFVQECFDAGLTKEAAAELLQYASVKNAGSDFLQGYLDAGGIVPVIHACDFEKAAARPPSALLKAFRSAVDVPYELGKSVIHGAQSGVRGLRNIWGPGTHVGRRGQVLEPWAKRHWRTASLGGIGLAAGGTYLANRLTGDPAANPDLMPVLPPGGYDPNDAKALYDQRLEASSKGIAESNRRYNQSNVRRKQLEEAIARGDINSAAAQQGLRELDRMRSSEESRRSAHQQQLNRTGASSQQKLDYLRSRRDMLERHRTSLWGLPRRLWYNMNGDGLDAQQTIDREMDKAQQGIGAHTANVREVGDQLRRMHNDYRGSMPQPRSTPQIQRDFFPNYTP